MKEHDLSCRRWGRNYEIMRIHDGGERLDVALWATPLPRAFDFLLLRHPLTADGRTRYQISSIELCHNPRDMAFAKLKYSPRESDLQPAQGTPTEGGDAQQAPFMGGPVPEGNAPNSLKSPNHLQEKGGQ